MHPFIKRLSLILPLVLISSLLYTQNESLIWWNPAQHPIKVTQGQAWHGETEEPYDRLPLRAKTQVREEVWNLSKHNAGVMLRFRSNASEIVVRYQVSGNQAMPHMPATGVSGVDLYAIDSDGKWAWCRGQWTFSDTITYRFSGITPNDPYHVFGREYRLYLPLYNQVTWMEIGVPKESFFHPLATRLEKPIVVYGTSIAQGGCASRPGMAWTSIVERALDHPLINLAFSGNGRLEPELINLISEIDAKLFILDCLPNLTSEKNYPEAEITKRLTESVDQLRKKHPQTPILLVEHAGYTDGRLMSDRQIAFQRINQIQKQVFAHLLAKGLKNLHYLSYAELDLQMDDMVDGTHPNDLGMQHYADAYERKLRTILSEPKGSVSTTQPCTQYREPGNYDWEERHRDIINLNRQEPPKTILFANSIVHFWGGLPKSKKSVEPASWDKLFTLMGVRNFAYGWDRIENVLWRLYHGELDGFEAEKILLMIGTNNLHLNTDQEVLEGLQFLTEAVKTRQPGATVILMGILPRRNYEVRISNLNLEIARLAADLEIRFADIGSIFMLSEEKIDEKLFSDGLHPNEPGYLKMRDALLPILK